MICGCPLDQSQPTQPNISMVNDVQRKDDGLKAVQLTSVNRHTHGMASDVQRKDDGLRAVRWTSVNRHTHGMANDVQRNSGGRMAVGWTRVNRHNQIHGWLGMFNGKMVDL